MTTLADFELGALLGGGTVAEVRAARDRSGRPVTLKILRPELRADGAQRALLREEGELGLRLSHPCLRRYLALIDEPPALVLEAVEGATLLDSITALRTRNEPVPSRRALLLVREVAKAIAYLHEKGVAHLGVLPQNVLLAQDGRVLLIDLSHGRWPGRQVSLSFSPSPEPSPYACPELWRGVELSFPADVYRLGILLWHLLALAPPSFAGEGDVSALRLSDPALALPEREPILHRLLRRLTHSDPNARPRANAQLLAEFERILRALPDDE